MLRTNTWKFSAAVVMILVGMLPVVSRTAIINVPGDYPTIQQALDAAQPGQDTLHIANGLYNENIVAKDGVDIIGVGGGVRIVGFGEDYTIRVQNHNTDVTIQNVFISHQSGPFVQGSGLFIDNSSPTVVECTIQDIDISTGINVGGAGARIVGLSDPHFIDCVFSNNKAVNGGGIRVQNKALSSIRPGGTFTNCLFDKNEATALQGGALDINYSVAPDSLQPLVRFEGCKFVGNKAFRGGVVIWAANAQNLEFQDCVFTENRITGAAYSQGVLYGVFSGLSLKNCTFAVNDRIGSLLYQLVDFAPFASTGQKVDIANCLFAFNVFGYAIDNRTANLTVVNSDFFGNAILDDFWVTLPGAGNLNLDPLFCDSSNGDLNLHLTSPCAARNTGAGVGTIGALDVGTCSPIERVTVYGENDTVGRFRLESKFNLLTGVFEGLTYAVTCPQGDIDRLVIEVEFVSGLIPMAISADRIAVGQPEFSFDGGAVQLFGELTADTTVFPGVNPIATITVENVSGCGLVQAPILLDGMRIGATIGSTEQQLVWTMINVKSPDKFINDPSCSRVDLADLADFAHAFGPSGTCDPDPIFDSCWDMNGDSCVSLQDLSLFAFHFGPPGHTSCGTMAMAIPGVNVLESPSLRLSATGKGVDIGLNEARNLTLAAMRIRVDSDLDEHYLVPNLTCCEHVVVIPVKDAESEFFVLTSWDEPVSGTVPLLVSVPYRLGMRGETRDPGEHVSYLGGEAFTKDGRVVTIREGMEVESTIPLSARNGLMQNSPNPFNPATSIRYSVAQNGLVNLSIYDARGGLVRTLVDGVVERGTHSVQWDGRNSFGRRVASGVYWYRLKIGSFVETKSLVLLK